MVLGNIFRSRLPFLPLNVDAAAGCCYKQRALDVQPLDLFTRRARDLDKDEIFQSFYEFCAFCGVIPRRTQGARYRRTHRC